MVLVLVVVGCTGDGDQDTAAPSPPASEVIESEAPTPAPSPSRSPRPVPSPTPALPARFSQDSDGNVIPDFLETELGYDPLIDDCALEGCPEVAGLPGTPVTTQQNTLLVLDSSGSMAGDDGTGRTKIEAARDALERYVTATPASFAVGLTVFGHRGDNTDAGRPESCAGIDTFAPLGQLNADNVTPTLAQLQPAGWTPIAGALDRAGQEFAGREGQANRVILITDGLETCDGDPVAAARRLAESGVAIRVDVVGFDIANTTEEAALRQIAEASGGTYTTASTGDQLRSYFQELIARQGELFSAIVCIQGNTARTGNCVRSQAVDAQLWLQEYRDENRDERQAVSDLTDRIMAFNLQRQDDLLALRSEQVDVLREELRQAEERYRQRYGEGVALLQPPCVPGGGPAPVGRTV